MNPFDIEAFLVFFYNVLLLLIKIVKSKILKNLCRGGSVAHSEAHSKRLLQVVAADGRCALAVDDRIGNLLPPVVDG